LPNIIVVLYNVKCTRCSNITFQSSPYQFQACRTFCLNLHITIIYECIFFTISEDIWITIWFQIDDLKWISKKLTEVHDTISLLSHYCVENHSFFCHIRTVLVRNQSPSQHDVDKHTIFCSYNSHINHNGCLCFMCDFLQINRWLSG
jgi:hypothetical protein